MEENKINQIWSENITIAILAVAILAGYAIYTEPTMAKDILTHAVTCIGSLAVGKTLK